MTLLPLLFACAAAAAPYDSVLLEGAPHVRQAPDFCGEACLVSAVARLGHETDQDAVFALTGIAPEEGRGAWTRELVTATQALGFAPGRTWYEARRSHAKADLEARWSELHADLQAGIPSIVCMHYDDRPNTTEHFRLVLGYDADSDEVIYHEVAEDGGALARMDRRRFLRLWPLKYDRDTWTVVRLRLDPTTLTVPPPAPERSVADYAQHVLALREDLPAGYTVVVEPPWVIVGNEDPAVVRKRAEGTVRWATRLLRQDYFPRDPADIWTVWLFEDADSYEQVSAERFGGVPDTPYGFATDEHKALVMNISTGGGTLVHEMVHPYIDANLPAPAPWFNEGLASLYEACSEREGRIVGLTNWRVHDLQASLVAQEVGSFEQLMSRNSWQFYQRDPGTNYAQARYLLQYLQDHDLLPAYYRAYAATQDTDPTGYAALRQVLGDQDMATFEVLWADWVLGL